MVNYEKIDTFSLGHNSTYLHYDNFPEIVHLDDQAHLVMENFDSVKVHTIKEKKSLDNAIEEFKASHINLLLVINDENHITGLLSSSDTLGSKPMAIIEAQQIKRENLQISALMIAIEEIPCIDADTVKKVRVGNILTTMRSIKTDYLLAVKSHNTEKQTIAGVFRMAEITKHLQS